MTSKVTDSQYGRLS